MEPETKTTKTDDRMALMELVEKSADDGPARNMLAFTARRRAAQTAPKTMSRDHTIHKDKLGEQGER